MLEVQRAAERYRGGDSAAGIDTRHAFSFSGFYDPDNVRFGPLTACNEETLAPGAGFAAHSHRDLEIVTWVLRGALTHEDSAGHATVVHPGDMQRLTAGSGVRHVERNAGPGPLRFLQMWLVPSRPGGEPEYEVVRGLADDTPYVLPRTPAALRVLRLEAGRALPLPHRPWVYLHVAGGSASLDGWHLDQGDAVRVRSESGVEAAEERVVLAGGAGAELLLWEMGPGTGA